MTSIRILIRQLRTGLHNLLLAFFGVLKKPGQYINKLFAPQEEVLEIPEAWVNPESVEETASIDPMAPVAVEPSVVFDDSVNEVVFSKAHSWVMKFKRITAFLLFIGCFISSIGLVINYPVGLIFVVPTAIINVDYLLKTQPKTKEYALHILDDVEELRG